jgi:hypothetical protein
MVIRLTHEADGHLDAIRFMEAIANLLTEAGCTVISQDSSQCTEDRPKWMA